MSEFLLDENELELVNNSEWLFAKARIIQKVYTLFGLLSQEYLKSAAALEPLTGNEIFQPSAKIYQGEKYRQLPYVMLDYPRFFGKDDQFAIRSLFWWGNHFSIHLLLSGRFAVEFRERLLKNLGNNGDWFIGVNKDPWEHHFGSDNYQRIGDSGEFQTPHLKFGTYLMLEHWAVAEHFFRSRYDALIRAAIMQ